MSTRACTAAVVMAMALAVGGCQGAGGGSSSSPSEGSVPAGSNPPMDQPMSVSIGAAGDILAHSPVVRGAASTDASGAITYDFGPNFAEMADTIAAPDVSICHLETPLSPDNTDLSVPGTKVFNVPHEMADALKGAGYDGCDFAGNHSWDRGLRGIADTASILDHAGLVYAGPSAADSPRGQVGWYDVDGLSIANLAYGYSSVNTGSPSTEAPPEAPWLVNSTWSGRGKVGILQDAAWARAEGADFVVLSMHWGAEYVTEPTEEQRSLAQSLLASDDVDLIIGTHVHVVQPCEKINGKYVFYGLGNSLSNQSPQTANSLRPETQEGVFVTTTLTRNPAGATTSRASYQPTFVDLDGHVITKATETTHPTTFERVTSTLQGEGTDSCPLTVG